MASDQGSSGRRHQGTRASQRPGQLGQLGAPSPGHASHQGRRCPATRAARASQRPGHQGSARPGQLGHARPGQGDTRAADGQRPGHQGRRYQGSSGDWHQGTRAGDTRAPGQRSTRAARAPGGGDTRAARASQRPGHQGTRAMRPCRHTRHQGSDPPCLYAPVRQYGNPAIRQSGNPAIRAHGAPAGRSGSLLGWRSSAGAQSRGRSEFSEVTKYLRPVSTFCSKPLRQAVFTDLDNSVKT